MPSPPAHRIDHLQPGSLTAAQAHLLSLFFASAYVGSLYISKRTRLSFAKSVPRSTVRTTNHQNQSNDVRKLEPRERQRNERWRDDEDVIRARLIASFASTFLCCMTVVWVHWILLPSSWDYNRTGRDRFFDALDLTLFRLGITTHPLSVTSHLITPVLFAGSLYSMYLFQTFPFMINWSYRRDVLDRFWSWQGIRNYVCAPVTEELVFRACILAVHYLSGLGRTKMIFLTPLTFGLAHVHHAWETFNVYGRTRAAAKRALLVTCVQLSYTTLFGAYCSYIFLRTGSIYPPISAHLFCNIMGLPEMTEEMKAFPSKKYLIAIAYLAGICAFVTKLAPWTRSEGNVYWN